MADTNDFNPRPCHHCGAALGHFTDCLHKHERAIATAPELGGLWAVCNYFSRVSTPPADDALCESLIEASDMRWNGDVYVGDGADLMNLVRAALRARAVPEGKKYHDVAQRLYALLDDIDTAGDIAKSDDKLYRGIVERTQAKKRDFVVSCDGYTVTLADDSLLTASKEGESS